MSIPAICTRCGLSFDTHNLIGGTGTATIVDCGTNCPRCGGPANLINGTYDLVSDIVRTFSQRDVRMADVARFRDVATQVGEGAITVQEADAAIGQMGAALQALWRNLNANGAAIGLLLTVITIYLMIVQAQGGDLSASKQLQAAQEQTEELRSTRAIQEAILRELQSMRESRLPAEPISKSPGPNRRERRKAKALERRSHR